MLQLSPRKRPKEVWSTIHRILNPNPEKITADTNLLNQQQQLCIEDVTSPICHIINAKISVLQERLFYKEISNFPGGLDVTRTPQIFQQETKMIQRGKMYYNISKFPVELYQNSARTHTTFQEVKIQ